jgi:hypothetical protein
LSRLQRQTSGKKVRRNSNPIFDEIHAEVMAKVSAFFSDPKRVRRWKRRLRRAIDPKRKIK